MLDYSTQDKFMRGNIRINLDVDLFKHTQLRSNIFTSLSEMQAPCQHQSRSLIYNTPAVAFPVRNENGVWGGNSTWSGDNNPVASRPEQPTTRFSTVSSSSMLKLCRDLCMVTNGLKFNVGASYDVNSDIHEDHSRKYNFGMSNVTGWVNGEPQSTYWEVADQATEMGSGSSMNYFARRLNAWAAFSYDNQFGDNHRVMGQLKYHYDYEDPIGVNNNVYRHNISLQGPVYFRQPLFSGRSPRGDGIVASRPRHEVEFLPNVSLGAVILNDESLPVNFLKARASWGIRISTAFPAIMSGTIICRLIR